MLKQLLPFDQTGRFSGLATDFLNGKEALNGLYNYAPDRDGLDQAIADRSNIKTNRELLVRVLRSQYEAFSPAEQTRKNIEALLEPGTFTVTTGHQLCLFGGPLYFVYKILSAIDMAAQLNASQGENHFVPVFWMASEDHDFEEVNHFHALGNRYTWEQEAGGPVGHFETDLDQIAQDLSEKLGDRSNAEELIALFRKCYCSGKNLSEATRILVMELFDHMGVVIIDADDPELKASAVPIFQKELLESQAIKAMEGPNKQLINAGYHNQVTAREINLFYMKTGLRQRIVREGDRFSVLKTDLTFSASELLTELKEHPERFSPNVVMRPVYQEFILPNIAYIGGGGELAYWLQLKEVLMHYVGFYPVVWLRNSFLWMDRGSMKKMNKLELETQQLFEQQDDLIKAWVKANAVADLDISDQKSRLEAIYKELAEGAVHVDPSLVPSIMAEYKKQLKSIENIGGRMIRAEKKRQETGVNQLKALLEKGFPGGGLQERHDHFTTLWLHYGKAFVDELRKHTNVFDAQFAILREEA